MEVKKIIVGVIIAHVLWYILFGIFKAYITESILCSAIAWIYLLCVYFQKQMSIYWITINKWLIPIRTISIKQININTNTILLQYIH